MNAKQLANTILLSALLQACTQAVDEESVQGKSSKHTSEQNRAAMEFTVDELHLGMTFDEICEVLPDGKEVKQWQQPSKNLERKTVNTDKVYIQFFEEKAYSIDFNYSPSMISALGGYGKMLERVVKKVGKPDKTFTKDNYGKPIERPSYMWYFPGKWILLWSHDDGTVVLGLLDRMAADKLHPPDNHPVTPGF